MLIQVLRIKTGDGKTLYTKEINGPFVGKLAPQIEHKHRGIKEMELIVVESSDYYNLSVDELAVLEL